MINLESVIRHFGAAAVRLQLAEVEELDNPALFALRDQNAVDRLQVLVRWFNNYQVFQGFLAHQRLAVAAAVLQWADARDLQMNSMPADALIEAHAELVATCCNAYGQQRDIKSLASKALWLCYPHDVPMFDSFVQRALWAIAKFEDGVIQGVPNQSEFGGFVHIWKILYDRYSAALDDIDMSGYPYRVRIFDKILWIIGYPDYEYRP